MSDVIVGTVRVSIVTFVVGPLVGLGLSLTVQQILTPLKDVKLVLLGVAAGAPFLPKLAQLARRSRGLLGRTDGAAHGGPRRVRAPGAPPAGRRRHRESVGQVSTLALAIGIGSAVLVGLPEIWPRLTSALLLVAGELSRRAPAPTATEA